MRDNDELGVEVGREGCGRSVMDKNDPLEDLQQRIRELQARLGELERQNKELRSIFENAAEGINQTTPEGRYLTVNPAFARMMGYSLPEEMMREVTDIGRQIYVDPEDRESLKKLFAEKGRVDGFEARVYRRDGRIIWVSINARAVRDETGAIAYYEGTHENITERKRADLALRESEERFRTLFEFSPVGITIARKGVTLYANQACRRMFGYHDPSEALGTSQLNRIAPSCRQEISENIANREKGLPVPNAYDTIGLRKDGTTFPLHVEVARLQLTDGLATVAFLEDITERKQAVEELRRREEEFKALVENSPDIISRIDRDMRIVYTNPAMERLTGFPGSAYLDKKVRDLPYPESLTEIWEESARRAFETGQELSFESNLPTPKGQQWHEYRLAPEFAEDGSVASVLLVGRVITDRKNMEEELLKEEKLEVTSILAGGIAHDFNNLLAVILGNINLARMSRLSAGDRDNVLKKAEEACSQAANLTRQFLTLSKGGTPSKRLQSLRELISDVVSLALSGSSIKPEVRFADDLWLTYCDWGQIQQALMNLLINAREAMDAGGAVEVVARNVHLSEGEIPPLQEGRYIHVLIKDYGKGIPKEILASIFDPYFSTKSRGAQKGMGLGLTMAYSIIIKHGGQIVVESTVGVGSKFNVYLPAVETPVEEPTAPQREQSAGSGRILVMDDEEMLLEVISSMLELLGYEVELAREGFEALQLFKSAKDSGRPFDAVILDLTVRGGMGGKETIAKLLELDPFVKAILSSGYSDDPVLSCLDEYGFVGALRKPYQISELKEMLQNFVKS